MADLNEDDLALVEACLEIEPENDYELDDDPWQHLSELVDEDAARALAVVAEIARRSTDVTTLSGLGEGAIEELLEARPDMVDAVVAEARRSPGIRIALGFAWTGGLGRADQLKLNQLLKN
jgi:hypothetical protein